MGAWIEIWVPEVMTYRPERVAPLVGAWIEIPLGMPVFASAVVAPLVGAWIEMCEGANVQISVATSLPLWERGLKCHVLYSQWREFFVAPLVGAWIEISSVRK